MGRIAQRVLGVVGFLLIVAAIAAFVGAFSLPSWWEVLGVIIGFAVMAGAEPFAKWLNDRNKPKPYCPSPHGTNNSEELDPVEEQQRRIQEAATLLSAPRDDLLWKVAERRKGHISLRP